MSSYSYLTTLDDVGEEGLNDLKLWLRGATTRPNFLTSNPHRLYDLLMALHYAISEIYQRLDPDLAAVICAASEQDTGIELHHDDFWSDRNQDLEELKNLDAADIKAIGRAQVVQYLELARDEIAWSTGEINRLVLHCQNAKEMKALKLRRSFTFHPTPRKETLFSRVPEAVFRSVEDEDEEMLDIETNDDYYEAEQQQRSGAPERDMGESGSEDGEVVDSGKRQDSMIIDEEEGLQTGGSIPGWRAAS